MDTKLTLKLEEAVIEQAKRIARKRGTSLSKMVENYLKSLADPEEKKEEITPLVSSLSGVIRLEEQDYRKSYTDYLTDKYQ